MNLVQFISSHFWETKNKRFVSFAKYFSLFSIIIGVVALLLSLAVLEGYDRTLREVAIKFTSHIIIQPFNRQNIDDYSSLINKMKSYSHSIKRTYPITQTEALIKHKDFTEGIGLRGVKPQYISDRVNSIIIAGNSDIFNKKAILIGNRLAKKINAKVGDFVHIFFLKSTNLQNISYKTGKFEVAGIFQSQMAQYDDLVAYADFAIVQQFMGLDSHQATNIEIFIDDVTKANKLGSELEQYLGFPYYSLTVFDLHRSVFSWIELQKEPIPIILGLISIIAAFNIITTLLILILEKMRQIGILRSLGMTKLQIVGLFISVGVRLAIVGLLAGCTISLVLSYVQKEFGIIRLNGEIYFLDVLPIRIEPFHYLVVVVSTFLLSLFATLVPSLIASKVKIVNALRFK